jgi:Plasmid pRiA4b ORF-3-like protein
MPRERKAGDTGEAVWQLKVTLLDSQPPIWRRFHVESGVTLERLHHILQVVMGWTDSHMHGFRQQGAGPSGRRRRLLPIESADEKATRVADVLRRPKDKLFYEYDFGDSWEHEVVLERIVPRTPGERYPMVVAGRGACPPEDVGGLSGYYHFLEAVKDARHPDHEEMMEWAGGRFDAAAFDVQAANRMFHGGWGPRRPAV